MSEKAEVKAKEEKAFCAKCKKELNLVDAEMFGDVCFSCVAAKAHK